VRFRVLARQHGANAFECLVLAPIVAIAYALIVVGRRRRACSSPCRRPDRRIGMRTWSQRWRRRDAGASAVEMAIVLPLLTFLVMGVVDLGRALNAEIQLSQGAREGVRLAALAGGNAAYDKAAVRARVILAAPAPGFSGSPTVADADITLCTNTSPPTAVASVTAKLAFRGILWTPGGGTLQQTAVMRCGG
jgi:Flp pilus assembly protein TadG